MNKETHRTPHKIWAEQDDNVSRLMIQIGDDEPHELLRYARQRALPEATRHPDEIDEDVCA